MKLKLLIISAFCISTLSGLSQSKKLQFQTIIAAGIVEGEESNAMQVQTVNGVLYKTWFSGIGVGLDYYNQRSIPLFLDLRKNVFDKQRSPFIYVDGGYHFPWLTKNEKAEYGGDIKTNGGLYYDAGVGYQMRNIKGVGLAFSAGYSYKRFSNEVPQYVYCIWGDCPQTNQTFDYRLKRISIKAALGF
jgi:hypothetical protein